MTLFPPLSQLKKLLKNHLFDLFCLSSVIGIWPRFIEPNMLFVKKLSLPCKQPGLDGLSIALLSDLHLGEETKPSFLKRILQKTKKINPDLILFAGDFIIRSELKHPRQLQAFLNELQAPLGAYAVLGNHDYASPLSINQEGDYDTSSSASETADLKKGIYRLLSNKKPSGKYNARAQSVAMHSALLSLIKETPVKVLHNECISLTYRGSAFNLVGLGDYMSGHFRPKQAFSHYQKEAFGIVLCHNPDACKELKEGMGDLILSGHTHGAQVNIPLLWNKLTWLENPLYKRGLIPLAGGASNKQLYVSRGLGGRPFRFLSAPEITHITLKRE
ncbi:MAG: yaeI [Chlamydiales bacterium]|jgi:predicted MPP superfamily phosphohydrolase|nr:yaeI [Chlamydiales bacterium]